MISDTFRAQLEAWAPRDPVSWAADEILTAFQRDINRKLGTRRRESTRRLGTVILKDIIYAGVFQRPCRDLAGGHATWVKDQGRSHDTAERVRKWMTRNGWIAKIDRVRNKFRWYRFKGSTPVFGIGDRIEDLLFGPPKSRFASPSSLRTSSSVRGFTGDRSRAVSRTMRFRGASGGRLEAALSRRPVRSESSDERQRSKPSGNRNRSGTNPAICSSPRSTNPDNVDAAPNPLLKEPDETPEVRRLPVDQPSRRIQMRRARLSMRKRHAERQGQTPHISERNGMRVVLPTDRSATVEHLQRMRSEASSPGIREGIQRTTGREPDFERDRSFSSRGSEGSWGHEPVEGTHRSSPTPSRSDRSVPSPVSETRRAGHYRPSQRDSYDPGSLPPGGPGDLLF